MYNFLSTAGTPEMENGNAKIRQLQEEKTELCVIIDCAKQKAQELCPERCKQGKLIRN